tara:strand:+ start:837 stop:1427 length:591 start_codon:yes stop_codon:yes gene_type:complete
MISIAITGGVATGKTTVLKQFKLCGVETHNSDLMVKEIYNNDKSIILKLEQFLPQVIINKKINIKELSKIAFNNKKILNKLENIIHPKLASKRKKILRVGKINYKKSIVFEIPLLYEKNLNNEFDFVVTTRCCKQLQKTRALKRRGMNEKKYRSIIKNQINNNIKYKNSNQIIDTGIGKNHSLIQVKKIINKLCVK